MIFRSFNNPNSNNDIEKRIVYRYPAAQLILEAEYTVPKYRKALARFTLFKYEQGQPLAIDNTCKEYGIMFTSGYNVHDIYSFDRELGHNKNIRLYDIFTGYSYYLLFTNDSLISLIMLF